MFKTSSQSSLTILLLSTLFLDTINAHASIPDTKAPPFLGISIKGLPDVTILTKALRCLLPEDAAAHWT